MIDQQLENKFHQDVAKVKRDLGTLESDAAAQVGKFEEKVNQSSEGLSTLVENSVSQLSDGFEKLKEDAKKTVINATTTAKKDVGEGLTQYNAKAKEVADKILGGFSKKSFRSPWVALAIILFVGVMLATFLKPTR